jgi:demethylmenaquinone methyltransferase/2-methoxy-6-polyprenyl-1,4-benzoquinol methylase
VVSERTQHARWLFAGLGATYDRMGALLSFGQDPRWRRFLVSRVPADAERVLDVATGTAAVAVELVGHGSGRRVVGLDQSEPMLRTGVARAREAGAGDRVAFVVGHGERLPFAPGTFDALTFTYLFRYVDDPAAALRGLADVVKPGGTIASLEFGVPTGVWHPLWWAYTRAVLPIVGRLASLEWYEVGRFLGPSISAYARRWPLEEQLAMWREAGIAPVRARRMSLGGGVVIWGTRRAP